MKKVTIIMPVYNNKQETDDAINSIVENIHYPNYELIIVESESTDGTAESVDAWAGGKIKVFHTKKEGLTKAINFGIKNSDPESDIYLTQNDVIHYKLYKKDWLTWMVKASEQFPEAGLITTLAGGGTDTKGDYLLGLNWVGTWSMYIPRNTINKVGLFDEEYAPNGDDVDFSYRVCLSGLKILVLPFWVEHHRLTENTNDSSEKCQLGAKRFRQKFKLGEFAE